MQYAFLDDYTRCYMAEDNEYVNSLSKSLAYTGASVNLEDDKLLEINGVTNINDSVSSYLKAMLQSGKGELQAQEVIPQRTAFYMSLSVADFSTFHGTFEQVMQTNPTEYAEYQRNVNKIEKFLKISLKENFIKWIGEEVAFVQTQPKGLGKNNEFTVVIKANDIKEAQKNLDFINRQIRRKTPVKFKEVAYKNYHINFMSVKGFFKPILGKFFEKLDKPYFTIIDDYVVFSNHPQTLKSIIDDFDAGNTLAKSEAFTDFLGHFETASNVFVYVQTPVLHSNLKGFVSPETWADVVKNKDYIVCFPQIGFQLTENGELFNTRLLSLFQDPADKSAEEVILATTTQEVDSTKVTQEADDEMYIEDLNAEKYTENHVNGTLKLEVQMKDGFRNGVYKEYYPNGELKIKGRYRSDQKDGNWKYYDSTGHFIEKRKFDQGKLLSNDE
jgi:hypothetical protein